MLIFCLMEFLCRRIAKQGYKTSRIILKGNKMVEVQVEVEGKGSQREVEGVMEVLGLSALVASAYTPVLPSLGVHPLPPLLPLQHHQSLNSSLY